MVESSVMNRIRMFEQNVKSSPSPAVSASPARLRNFRSNSSSDRQKRDDHGVSHRDDDSNSSRVAPSPPPVPSSPLLVSSFTRHKQIQQRKMEHLHRTESPSREQTAPIDWPSDDEISPPQKKELLPVTNVVAKARESLYSKKPQSAPDSHLSLPSLGKQVLRPPVVLRQASINSNPTSSIDENESPMDDIVKKTKTIGVKTTATAPVHDKLVISATTRRWTPKSKTNVVASNAVRDEDSSSSKLVTDSPLYKMHANKAKDLSAASTTAESLQSYSAKSELTRVSVRNSPFKSHGLVPPDALPEERGGHVVTAPSLPRSELEQNFLSKIAPCTTESSLQESNHAVEWPEQKKMDCLIEKTKSLLIDRTASESQARSSRRARRSPIEKRAVVVDTTRAKAQVIESTQATSIKDAIKADANQTKAIPAQVIDSTQASFEADAHPATAFPEEIDEIEGQQNEVFLNVTAEASTAKEGHGVSAVKTQSSPSFQSQTCANFLSEIALRALEASLEKGEGVEVSPSSALSDKQPTYIMTEKAHLKRSLNDASVVIREERESSVGTSSSLSSRSSLSVDVLGSIARRAMMTSQEKEGLPIRSRTSSLRSKVVQQRKVKHLTVDLSTQSSQVTSVVSPAAQYRKLYLQKRAQSLIGSTGESTENDDSSVLSSSRQGGNEAPSEIDHSSVFSNTNSVAPKKSRSAMFKAAHQRVAHIGVVRHGLDDRSSAASAPCTRSSSVQGRNQHVDSKLATNLSAKKETGIANARHGLDDRSKAASVSRTRSSAVQHNQGVDPKLSTNLSSKNAADKSFMDPQRLQNTRPVAQRSLGSHQSAGRGVHGVPPQSHSDDASTTLKSSAATIEAFKSRSIRLSSAHVAAQRSRSQSPSPHNVAELSSSGELRSQGPKSSASTASRQLTGSSPAKVFAAPSLAKVKMAQCGETKGARVDKTSSFVDVTSVLAHYRATPVTQTKTADSSGSDTRLDSLQLVSSTNSVAKQKMTRGSPTIDPNVKVQQQPAVQKVADVRKGRLSDHPAHRARMYNLAPETRGKNDNPRQSNCIVDAIVTKNSSITGSGDEESYSGDDDDIPDETMVPQPSFESTDGTSTLPSRFFHGGSEQNFLYGKATSSSVSSVLGTSDTDYEETSSCLVQDRASLSVRECQSQSTLEPLALKSSDGEGTTDFESTLMGEFHIKSSSTEDREEQRYEQQFKGSRSLLGPSPEVEELRSETPQQRDTHIANSAMQWLQNTYAWTQVEGINSAPTTACSPSGKANEVAYIMNQKGLEKSSKGDDESIFSGIEEIAIESSKPSNSIDDGNLKVRSIRKQDEGIRGRQEEATENNSFEDDIFSGCSNTNSIDSSNFMTKQDFGLNFFSSRSPAGPPPPPSSRFGTLLDSSATLETVHSDITSSLLAGTGPNHRDTVEQSMRFDGAAIAEESSNQNEDQSEGTSQNISQKSASSPEQPRYRHKSLLVESSDDGTYATKHSKLSPDAGPKSRHRQKSLLVESSDDGTYATKQSKLSPVACPQSRHRQKSLLVESSDDGTYATKQSKLTPDAALQNKQSSAEEDDDEEAIEDEMNPGTFFRFGHTLVETFFGGICQTRAPDIDPNDADDLHMSEAHTSGLDVLSVVSRSTGTSNSSVSIAESELTEKEKQVWDAWDSRDYRSMHVPFDAKSIILATSEQQPATQASGIFAGFLGSTPGMFAPSVTVKPPLKRGLSGLGSATTSEDSSISQYTGLSEGVSSSDMSSKMMIFEDSTEDTSRRSEQYTSRSRTTTSASISSSQEPRTSGSTASDSVSINQHRIIEEFNKSLRKNGVQVLKLSRDNKWQLRYLTVSTETRIVKFGESKVGGQLLCPQGILWQKRFNPRGKEASVSCIDDWGHGGMIVEDLRSVAASMKVDKAHPIPRKFATQFHDSVAVVATYNLGTKTRSLMLRCKTTEVAHFVCTGLRVVIDVLKREAVYKMNAKLQKSADDEDESYYESAESGESSSRYSSYID